MKVMVNRVKLNYILANKESTTVEKSNILPKSDHILII